MKTENVDKYQDSHLANLFTQSEGYRLAEEFFKIGEQARKKLSEMKEELTLNKVVPVNYPSNYRNLESLYKECVSITTYLDCAIYFYVQGDFYYERGEIKKATEFYNEASPYFKKIMEVIKDYINRGYDAEGYKPQSWRN